MGKYPELNHNTIAMCISKINRVEFDTYDFISMLKTIDVDYVNMISGIGNGWKSIVGRNLAKYAVETQKIKKKSRKGSDQLWLKT